MTLTVLNVAFPFARISADPVGGAEQVLAHLDRALVGAGHRSIVVAAEGSCAAGELVPIPRVPEPMTDAERLRIRTILAGVLERIVASVRVDVVHLHGIDFHAYLPQSGPPIVVTLHLPLAWYSPGALQPSRGDVWLQPVSRSQMRGIECTRSFLPPLENGVATDGYPRVRKRGFALILSRICPEKGIHDAMEAARIAGLPLVIAGQAFEWPEHRRYLLEVVAPRLSEHQWWIGPVYGLRKRRLLAAARCVLVPSLVEETSSLVAMEALAAGTPVIAYGKGALPEIIEHGETGFLVENVAGMAWAIRCADTISPERCRAVARERFALERSMQRYLSLYATLTGSAVQVSR